ncbi:MULTISPECIES: SAM-dependent methyltransferase [Thermomonosporaceae]|uniref:SAM-dependent methyltransferase n=1 Tax=Thermomonosporaceae TaxID=2012 RepID=UPI00255AD1F6|nr:MULTISPECIES: SAM-dependent methyltransferase [Thermomonosporaceae]MDL4772551.1 SAM-dependent methyltransferase [Actinomadura xylanilytica]
MADESPKRSPLIDTSVPHSARIWNYWLGGKDNYPVDREAGDQYLRVYPGIVNIARNGRQFLRRSVRYLAGEAGVRQFLDCGTGLPTADNTHEVAQRVAPDSHIVYVDHDPLVLEQAKDLLTSTPEGATSYIQADLNDPAEILGLASGGLDLDRPVALLFMGVLGHVDRYEDALSIVRTLMAGLAPGSYLALYDSTDADAALNQAQQEYDDTGAVPYRLRKPEQIKAYFDGLDVAEPGVVACEDWRPETQTPGGSPRTSTLCGVGRKP